MVSEPGDFVGGGINRLFVSPAVSIHLDAHLVSVSVKHGSESFSFDFAPPSGKRLEDGEYTDAERYPFEAEGSPGLTISGDSRGCNRDFGRFLIKDIHFAKSGKPTRFWALYEQHCETPEAPALFGEVRVGEPSEETPEVAVPAAVEWPGTAVDTSSVAVPVTVLGEKSGAQIASVSLQGADAGDFNIASDGCEGAELPPGRSCEVTVNARPAAAGMRTAQLVVTDESGAKTTVQLAVDAQPLLAIDSATLVSERGDWVGQGVGRLFDAPRSVSISGEGNHVEAHVESGGESFSFDFAAPAGKPLEVGEYIRAERYPFEAKIYPGLSVSGDGRGCNQDFGRFIIKDIHFNSSGKVDRLWAVYEQHCGDPEAPALFGEVRVGEPPTEAPEAAVPTAIDWPQTVVGASGADVPVTVIGGESGAHVTAVSLEGEDSGDFDVSTDECEGVTLAPREHCEVIVTVKPSAAGLRTAQLVITDRSGAKTTVQLAVDTEPPPEQLMASNSATLVSEAGDFIGGGQDLLIDAPEALSVSGERSLVDVRAEGKGETYSFEFAPPAGKLLQVGEYTGAERYPFEANGSPGLTVSGGARECNTDYGRFIIKDIHLNSSGKVDRFWALYEQHCEGREAPALFGEVRVGEPATEAPETVAPTAIDWPQTAVGSSSAKVPVTVGAGESGAQISSVSLEGEDAGDFTVASDGCEGATLAPRARCDLNVAAKPIAAGPLTAQLVIVDHSGAKTTVPVTVDAAP